MGHAPTVRSTLPELGLRKSARVLRSTLREWRAGTTASRAKGGIPGTTAVVPRRHLLASQQLQKHSKTSQNSKLSLINIIFVISNLEYVGLSNFR